MSLTCSLMQFLLWLRKSKANKAGLCPVMLRVFLDTHTRAEHSTGIRCKPADWGRQKLKGTGEAVDNTNRVLQNLVAKARLQADRLQSASPDSVVRPAEVVAALTPRVAPREKPLLTLLEEALTTYYAGKPGTRIGIQLALQYFRRWPAAKYLVLSQLTPSQGRAFATWLEVQPKLSAITRRCYLGNMASLLARAAPDHAAVFTGTGRTASIAPVKPRRALTVNWLRKLQLLPLSGLEAVARDLFMLQFYLHGSRVAAIIALQKVEIDWAGNRVRFTAMKVARHKDVELRPELRELLCRYSSVPGPFVLPLLPVNYLSLSVPERHRTLTLARMSMRSALVRVGRKLGWPGSLHSHLARHSLALRAFQVSGGLELPQGMLGHASISETATYIESISPQRLDAGAASVYDSLL